MSSFRRVPAIFHFPFPKNGPRLSKAAASAKGYAWTGCRHRHQPQPRRYQAVRFIRNGTATSCAILKPYCRNCDPDPKLSFSQLVILRSNNKYWFSDTRPAVGVYKDVLDPPVSVADVTYWMNYLLEQQQQPKYSAINAAVEATTLNERSYRLRPQDIFIRDNISVDDVLVVSIGGNDVALAPAPCTIASICGILALPMQCIESGASCCVCPVNDCCCGCGPSLLSCLGTCPPCLGYFRHLFGTRVQHYIEQLTAKTKPKKILVCMIYYPDENPAPSWANGALGALRYNTNPAKVQAIIRKAFEEATCRIRIEGSEVIPVPLFNVLDGKQSQHYVARVEPSALGGERMAEFLLDHILPDAEAVKTHFGGGIPAPATRLMADR